MVDPLGNTTTWVYEATGALCSPANNGNVCEIIDPLGHSTSYTYDSSGNVLTVTDESAEVWTYTYNAFNQVLTAEDPLTRVTEYEYDGNGNLELVTNALSEETAYVPNGDGTLDSVTDALLNTTDYTYDAYGNVETVTDPLTHEWSYTYDLGGRLLTETDPLTHVTIYTYDDQNNLLTTEDDLGNTTSFTYDVKGQRTSVTDANRQPVTGSEEGADCGAEGTGDGVDDDSDTVADDGCPNSIFENDDAGRLLSVTNAQGNSVSYGYDENGNRDEMTNTRGKLTAYTYDDANRLTEVEDPLARTTAYDYDDAGRLIERIDGNADTTAYTYDDVNQLLNINYQVGTADVTFTYDELGNRLTMADGTGTTTWTRDALYRPTAIEDGGASDVLYDYDEAGRLIELTYPGGVDSVVYGYDDAGRLETVTDWLSNVTTYTYDGANRLTSTALGNGLISDRTYDDADRLLSVENLDGVTPISSYDYTLDAVGNRVEMVDGTGTTMYGYDELYQLTDVEYPDSDTEPFTYDAMGNRLTQVINGGSPLDYTYDDADQMTDVEGTAYDYDDDGNQIEAGTDTFAWDHENRLTATNVDSVSGSYAYNGDGLRTSRTIASTTVDYVWDLNASLPVVLEDSDGNRFVYGLDLLTRINSTDEEWYLYDGLGSTTGLTDGVGDVTGAYAYDAFGTVRSQSGDTTEWSYTGEQVDSSGLQYLRARYYDRINGRFLSRDPLPLLQRYAYVENNPVRRTDPLGLRWDFEVDEAQERSRGGGVTTYEGGGAMSNLAAAMSANNCEANWLVDFGFGASGYAGGGGGAVAHARGAVSIDSCRDVDIVGTGGLGGGAIYGAAMNLFSTSMLFGTDNAGRSGPGASAGGCAWIGVGGCVEFTAGKGYGGIQVELGVGVGLSFAGTVDYTKVVKPWEWDSPW